MSAPPQQCAANQANPDASGGAGRFYGKYRGKVRANEDPLFMGRILAEVPLVPAAIGNWALPCTPYGGLGVGFLALPPIDADVWIEFEAGDPNFPIWTGCFWTVGTAPLVTPIPEWKIFKTEFLTMLLNDAPGIGGFFLEYFEPGAMASPFSITINKAGIEFSAPPALQTLIAEQGITLEYPEATIRMTAETITATVPPTAVTLTAEAASTESGEVNLTSTEATTIEAGADMSMEAGAAMEMSAGADVSVEAGGAAEVSAGLDLSMEAGLAMEMSAGLDVSLEAAGIIDAQAPDLALTGAAVEITAPAVAVTGIVEITGDELVDGQQVLFI
jgi:hypothetical protein